MEITKELLKVFIGSSMEGLDVAHAIQVELDDDAETTIWRQGIFDLSSNTLDVLSRILDKVDFGIFVLTPDDELKIRGQQSSAARDNVILEIGLFIGRLGKERTFLILPKDHDELHLPADLLGIMVATFNDSRTDKNLQAAVGTACTKIKTSIKNIGVFSKRSNIKPEYYLQKGDILVNLKNFGAALNAYEYAIQLDSDCAGAYVKKGDVFQKLKLFEEALAAYHQAICLDFNFTPAYISMGDTFSQLNRFKKALTAYEQAICLDPNSARAYAGKGYTLLRLGFVDEALAACECAIKLDANFAPAHDRKAIVLGYLERYQEALAAHEQAIHLDTCEAKFHNNKSATLRALGWHENALAACEQAILLDPHEVTFERNRFDILTAIMQQEKALLAREQAIHLDISKVVKIPVPSYCSCGKELNEIETFPRVAPNGHSHMRQAFFGVNEYNG